MKTNSKTGSLSCSIKMIHEDAVNRVKKEMPEVQQLIELAGFFKLFGDPTRISILWALSKSELCVCDLCALLEAKQSAVSHQLNKLRQSRIVKSRRDGKIIYYSLDDEHIGGVLSLGINHILEET